MTENSQSSQEVATEARRKALVVDDSDDSARVLELMVQSLGYDTLVAEDGVDALKKANEFQPNVVLLDLTMPKLDGYDVCRVIRAQPWAATVKIVAVTGRQKDEIHRKSQEAGFDGYLLKPVGFSTLEALLTN
jgi:CheY-like chemotaxis protein